MNLTHPAFFAFVQNIRRENAGDLLREIFTLHEYMPSRKRSEKKAKPGTSIVNLIRVMEEGIGGMFCLMEDDLFGVFRSDGREPFLKNGRLRLGSNSYTRMILTPLLMDFNVSGVDTGGIYYNRSPEKPLVKQIGDMFEGIKIYRRRRPGGFFDIFPFLGVNPALYSLKSLGKLFSRYLGFFPLPRGLFSKAFTFASRLDITSELSGRGLFSGLKLYPPLGFDPWPDGDPDELEKVLFIYEYCSSKGIPITTHCDDLGFRAVPVRKSMTYSDPARWRPVFERFPELKVNFAHFGRQYKRRYGIVVQRSWFREIIRLCLDYPNVYTDLSFTGCRPGFYLFLSRELAKMRPAGRDILLGRIMFGSDFMINLLEVPSYYDYLRIFEDSPLDEATKDLLFSKNPAAFLFGERPDS